MKTYAYRTMAVIGFIVVFLAASHGDYMVTCGNTYPLYKVAIWGAVGLLMMVPAVRRWFD